ncbi:MAG: OmpA family protein [Treponema sp.]|nr:OmpA family protein [Treponema sp.]
MKKICKKQFLLLLTLLSLNYGLNAQTEFPKGNYWALNGGIGIGDTLVKGSSYQFILDPKLWLSQPLMIGSRIGLSYSIEEESSNILSLEGQVYLRWNFFRFGREEKLTNIFIQGGLGLLTSYRGLNTVFDDVTKTRGSIMLDTAAGLTIPLTRGWHIEPLIRVGYPHIYGISLTAGYKFPLQQRTVIKTEYIMVNPPVMETDTQITNTQIIDRQIMINYVEYILFGPDEGIYNAGLDFDAQQLNGMVLEYTAAFLNKNPDYIVRIEGHANPITINPSEIDDLFILSSIRANEVAEQLKSLGVNNEQIVIRASGGTRIMTDEFFIRNRNRRVELTIIHSDHD